MNKHLCIDFETLSTSPDSAVLSLGAVIFTRDGIKSEKHYIFNLNEQLQARRSVSGDTLNWWFDQGPEAKALFKKTLTGQLVRDFVSDFLAWVDKEAGQDFRIWANGSDFDTPMLAHLLSQAKASAPWKFWNARCYRTMKSMFRIEDGMQRSGVKHDALDDARFQAQCVIGFLSRHQDHDR